MTVSNKNINDKLDKVFIEKFGCSADKVEMLKEHRFLSSKIGFSAANLINKTKDNAKIERIKDALINIIGHNRTSGDLGIPDFTSEFQFSNGAFSVADSGFTVDMAALDRRLTPQPHDNMYSDMYEYSFRKVL